MGENISEVGKTKYVVLFGWFWGCFFPHTQKNSFSQAFRELFALQVWAQPHLKPAGSCFPWTIKSLPPLLPHPLDFFVQVWDSGFKRQSAIINYRCVTPCTLRFNYGTGPAWSLAESKCISSLMYSSLLERPDYLRKVFQHFPGCRTFDWFGVYFSLSVYSSRLSVGLKERWASPFFSSAAEDPTREAGEGRYFSSEAKII